MYNVDEGGPKYREKLVDISFRCSGDGTPTAAGSAAPTAPLPPAPPLPVYLSIRILGARHLSRGGKGGRGLLSPFVEVEVLGAEYDNAKAKTKTIPDNGFNPFWDEPFEFR